MKVYVESHGGIIIDVMNEKGKPIDYEVIYTDSDDYLYTDQKNEALFQYERLRKLWGDEHPNVIDLKGFVDYWFEKRGE